MYTADIPSDGTQNGDTMNRRSARSTRSTRTPVAVIDVPAIDVPAESAAIVPVPEPEPAEPVATVDTVGADIDARIAAAFPDGSPASLAYVANMARAFAHVASMPVATVDDRAAVRDAIVARMTAAYPGATAPVGRNTGRFSGLHVFESQNTAYVAAAMSSAYVTDGHFVAAWAADVPTARCAYLTTAYDKRYPTSTITEYVHNRHNGVPGCPGARDVVVAWVAAKRNRPVPTA